MTIRVGVLGAAGRMGATVCDAVDADPDLSLVAAFDPNAESGQSTHGVSVSTSLDEVIAAALDVVVDFTIADAARANLPRIAAAGIHAVVGTTGFDDADMASLGAAFSAESGAHCLVAANFAISAVLMMRFAELAAPFFESGEVIELHHENKIDAPSGTAAATLDRMAAASSDWIDDPTEHEVYPGARGGSGPAGIRVHSVRMRGMVAHQEVILGAVGQSLTIRQDSYDRTSFMPGVVLACKRIADHPGLTVGLDPYLEI
ncbi:MAG: 4-hydroxy-tetrahydrodipicolinate reductase [Actinomycetota bacterium]